VLIKWKELSWEEVELIKRQAASPGRRDVMVGKTYSRRTCPNMLVG